MALTDYLHGVEYIQDPYAITPVEFPRSGVIGLVGTAPMQMVAADKRSLNKPVVVNSFSQAVEYFGPVNSAAQGFTLPQALEVVYQQGVSLVVVVNVFDHTDSSYYEQVTDEAVTLDGSRGTLSEICVWDVVVQSSDGSTTHVLDTDYKLDATNGQVIRLPNGGIAEDAELLVSFKHGTPEAVTSSDIIGTISPSGKPTGILAWKESFHYFGFNPRLLAAPGFSYDPGVASQLVSVAEELLAHAAIDAPVGATVAEAIAGRNDNMGTVQNFFFSEKRAVLCYPHLLNVHGDLVPMSAYWVGVAARTQQEFGYHWSPSNKPIRGVTGVEVALTSSYTSGHTDVQRLNEVGVVTIFGLAAQDAFAAGYRLWGNRSSAYPAATSPSTFVCIQIVEDQLRIGIERALLQYVDRPISATVISFILQTINGYISRQISRGILIGGRAFFNQNDNPADELALGHLTVRLDEAGPPPLERITVRARYNDAYLTQLGEDVVQGVTSRSVAGALQVAI